MRPEGGRGGRGGRGDGERGERRNSRERRAGSRLDWTMMEEGELRRGRNRATDLAKRRVMPRDLPETYGGQFTRAGQRRTGSKRRGRRRGAGWTTISRAPSVFLSFRDRVLVFGAARARLEMKPDAPTASFRRAGMLLSDSIRLPVSQLLPQTSCGCIVSRLRLHGTLTPPSSFNIAFISAGRSNRRGDRSHKEAGGVGAECKRGSRPIQHSRHP